MSHTPFCPVCFRYLTNGVAKRHKPRQGGQGHQLGRQEVGRRCRFMGMVERCWRCGKTFRKDDWSWTIHISGACKK